jgi:hypothetical protein
VTLLMSWWRRWETDETDETDEASGADARAVVGMRWRAARGCMRGCRVCGAWVLGSNSMSRVDVTYRRIAIADRSV